MAHPLHCAGLGTAEGTLSRFTVLWVCWLVGIGSLETWAQVCEPTDSTPVPSPAALEGLLEPVFIGCRSTPGECVNSCPDRRASWEVDPERCHPEGPEPLACSCLVESEPEPETPPEGAWYVGCRPSPGECVNSCPTRDAWMQEDPGSCPEEGIEGAWACYCL